MKNKIYLISYVTLCAFLVLKLIRGLSGVESQSGGLWNYIQLFFCVQVFFLLFNKKTHNPKPIRTFLQFLFICWFVSLFHMDTFIGSFPVLFKYAIYPYPGLICVIFFYYGTKYDIKKYAIILHATYYVLCALFIMSLRNYRLTDLGENVAISDVYYPLALLPFVMAITKYKLKVIPLVVAFLAVLFSGKRTAFLIVIAVLLIVYMMQPGFKVGKLLRNVIIVGIFFFVGSTILASFTSQFDIDILYRLQNIGEDGGSGRDERWEFLIKRLGDSSILELFVGHGFESVSIALRGGRAHNDFLEVFYNYGIVPFCLYVAFYIRLIKESIAMYRAKYQFSAEFLATVVCALFLAMFSFFIVEPTYITSSMFAISLMLADWYKTKNQYEIR